jgi:hypothetical protein
LFLRQGVLPLGEDIKFYDAGRFYVFCKGLPSGSSGSGLGLLHVKGHVTLKSATPINEAANITLAPMRHSAVLGVRQAQLNGITGAFTPGFILLEPSSMVTDINGNSLLVGQLQADGTAFYVPPGRYKITVYNDVDYNTTGIGTSKQQVIVNFAGTNVINDDDGLVNVGAISQTLDQTTSYIGHFHNLTTNPGQVVVSWANIVSGAGVQPVYQQVGNNYTAQGITPGGAPVALGATITVEGLL